jgi:hypothetical protein
MMKKLFTAAVLIGSLSNISSVQATVIIDNFDDASDTSGFQLANGGANGTTYSNTNTDLTNVLGGVRLLEIFDVANGTHGHVNASLQVNANDGQIHFANQGSVSSRGRISWLGENGLGINGNTGFDITDGGFNEVFIIDVVQSHPDIQMLFRVEDTDGDIAELNLVTTGPGLLEFFFEDFDENSSNTASTNFESIKFLTLDLFGPTAADTSFSFIQADKPVPAPEPASTLIFGLGLIAMRKLL